MRKATACLILLLVSSPVFGRAPADTLRFYLSNSDLVVAGKVVNEPSGEVEEAGVLHYVCDVQVSENLAGNPPKADVIRVDVVRFDGTGGVPEKDGEYIFFLRSSAPNIPAWETADFWFGILPYYRPTADAIIRVADQMREEARWQPLRELGDANRPEHIPKLMEIANGQDPEVVIAALSRLSNFGSDAAIADFLKQKMKHPNPNVALQAAIVSCYSGDWSGFEMLLAHVTHEDKGLRRKAIAQLVDCRFQCHADRIVPKLLERLHVETDPALVERTIESVGNYPSAKVLAEIEPYLEHRNKLVRGRAELVTRVIRRELADTTPKRELNR